MRHRKKVLVAMSGGVDSSVAACLLTERGYDVVGVFMRMGAEEVAEGASGGATRAKGDDGRATSDGRLPPGQGRGLSGQGPGRSDQGRLAPGQDRGLSGQGRLPPDQGRGLCSASAVDDGLDGVGRRQGCCSAVDTTDARCVAGKLGIPFYALNFEQDFSRLVDYFADEYAAARTPNPCVLCNQWLKFGKLLAYADAIQADLIATGHYARVETDGARPRLRRARDRAKDQSYVLFGTDPAALRRTLLPLGDMTKAAVRSHARRLGLSLHDKPESQDICFVPDRDYAGVVRSRRPDAFRRGRIRHVDGRVLGEHAGLAHFTIGQRRGLRVAVGSPVYVADLDAATDTVTVGPRESLCSPGATAGDVTWLGEPPTGPTRSDVQIRYHHAAAPADVEPMPDRRVRVHFDEPQLAITPGQAMVFYRGDEVLGGGWIIGRQA